MRLTKVESLGFGTPLTIHVKNRKADMWQG
jgi:hypothetical protein